MLRMPNPTKSAMWIPNTLENPCQILCPLNYVSNTWAEIRNLEYEASERTLSFHYYCSFWSFLIIVPDDYYYYYYYYFSSYYYMQHAHSYYNASRNRLCARHRCYSYVFQVCFWDCEVHFAGTRGTCNACNLCDSILWPRTNSLSP